MSLKKVPKYNVVIFGGSSGLGKDISDQFNKKEYCLHIFGKNKVKKLKAKNFYYKRCDLSKLIDIKKNIYLIKKKIKTIDLLILNSAVINFKKKILKEKYEYMYFVNFLSQFIILNYLKKNISSSKLKIVIIISSHVIFFKKFNLFDLQSLSNFNFWNSYKNSKYLLAIMAKKLFIESKNINFLLFNPGRIKSNLGYSQSLIGYLFKIYHFIFGIKTHVMAKRLYKTLIKLLKKDIFFYYYTKGNLVDLKNKNKLFFNYALSKKILNKLKNDKYLIKNKVKFKDFK